MKITVINGTGIKGVTWHMKERFLEKFRDSNEITEFVLPKDMPEFCVGCKNLNIPVRRSRLSGHKGTA